MSTEHTSTQTPEQLQAAQFDQIMDRMLGVLQVDQLSGEQVEQRLPALGEELNGILKSAVTEPEKLGTEILSADKQQAYAFAEAYLALASHCTEYDDEEAKEIFGEINNDLRLDPSLVVLENEYKENAEGRQAYKEEQSKHVEGLQEAIEAAAGRQARVQQRLHDASRKITHNQKLDAEKADVAARAATRKQFTKLFPDESAAAAEAFVEAHHGPKPEATNVADTEKLRAEKEQRRQKADAERAKTAAARNEFYKGFTRPEDLDDTPDTVLPVDPAADSAQVPADDLVDHDDFFEKVTADDLPPPVAEDVPDADQEKAARKARILQEFGFRQGSDSLHVLNRDAPQNNYVLTVLDVVSDQADNQVFITEITNRFKHSDGTVKNIKLKRTMSGQVLLEELTGSDRYLLSARYHDAIHNTDEEAIAGYTQDAANARKRDELRKKFGLPLAHEPETTVLPPDPGALALYEAPQDTEAPELSRSVKVRKYLGALATRVAIGMLTSHNKPEGYSRRTKVLGVAGALAGAYGLFKIGAKFSDSQDGMTAKEALDKAGRAARRPEIKEWTDNVVSNDGITHTFKDFAQSFGKEPTTTKVVQAFAHAQEAGLITPDHISNTAYMDVSGGLGFKGPGETQLSPDLVEFLKKEFKIK